MRLLVAGLLASGVLLTGCVDPDPSSPTPEDLADIDLSPDHTITVDDEGFSPASLDIVAGEVVLLVNEGAGPHTFTADEAFDTGRMEPGDETTLVLSDPGRIAYRDLEEPEHKGSITVARG